MVLLMEYDILHHSVFGFSSLCGVKKHKIFNKMFRDGSASVFGTRVAEVPIHCGSLLILMPERCSVFCIFKHLVVGQIQHNRQCTCNVTLRWLLNHCREWKNKICYIFWGCVCSCSYPACRAHGTILYCCLWPVWICHDFSHYVISGIIFGKKVLNIKYVLWFSLQLGLKHFSFWEELSMILSEMC